MSGGQAPESPGTRIKAGGPGPDKLAPPPRACHHVLMDYSIIDTKDAYRLQNAGGLVLVCTRGGDGRYDLAPVAWSCPLDYAPVSRILLVLDTGHRSYEDIRGSETFAAALPTPEQLSLVMRTGSCSGRDLDKYERYAIDYFPGRRADVRIPSGVAGWLECRLLRIVEEGTSGIVMGEVLHAEAAEDYWTRRIHYVTEGLMYRPGEPVS